MSDINSIQYTSYINSPSSVNSTNTTPKADTTVKSTAEESSSAAESGVVYEKSDDAQKVVAETKDGKVTEKDTRKADRSAIIKQMQDDMNARKQQLLDIVRKSMGQQATTFGIANSDDEDSIWSKFADGKVTVSEAAKAQAQEDISEDGYWGVKQTSDRILDFAKTLADGDSSKASELLEAFKKGYSQATKSWGRDLPDISSQTYDAVTEKFQKWMDGEEEAA